MRIRDLRDWLSAMREAREEWRAARRVDFAMGEPVDMDKLIAHQKVYNSMLSQILRARRD